jgi:hypothetical protein
MSTDRNEILKVLQQSEKDGLIVDLKLFHSNFKVTTIIEKIVGDVILVKPVSFDGLPVPRGSFYVDEIQSISCPRIFFNASLYTKLNKITSNLRQRKTQPELADSVF